MKLKVANMTNDRGSVVANQFLIQTQEGVYFQSYNTVIAFRPFDGGKIQLDRKMWDYSRTTAKYRIQFLRETKKETEAKIKTGEYELVDLN